MVPHLDQDFQVSQADAAGLLEDRIIGIGAEQLGKALLDALPTRSDPTGAKSDHDFLHESLRQGLAGMAADAALGDVVFGDVAPRWRY